MAEYNLPKKKPFDNGAVMWSVRNELLSASLVGFIRGGRYDSPKAVGSAHFGEHVWCHGVPESVAANIMKRCPERPRPVTERRANRTYRKHFGGSNGSKINIRTMTSEVGFGHQDLFRPKDISEVFPVIGGMVHDGMQDARDLHVRAHSVVSRRIFELERSAVLHETAENNEWPGMAGYRAALKALYTTNPARNFGDSEPEQLEAMRTEQLNFWLQTNLGPQTLRTIIIGPSQNAAVRLFREAGLDRVPEISLVPWWYDRSDDVPVLTDVRRIELFRNCGMSHVSMLWPTEPYGGSATYPLEVLVGLVKDRVEELQREELLAVYHPAAVWDASSSHGFFCIEFSTLKRGDACDRVIDRVVELVDGIAADRSDQFVQDVEDGRHFLANSYLEDYHYTPGAFADRMMHALANGDPELTRFNAYYSDMLHVSPERVRNAAKRYLRRDAFVLSVVRPAE